MSTEEEERGGQKDYHTKLSREKSKERKRGTWIHTPLFHPPAKIFTGLP